MSELRSMNLPFFKFLTISSGTGLYLGASGSGTLRGAAGGEADRL